MPLLVPKAPAPLAFSLNENRFLTILSAVKKTSVKNYRNESGWEIQALSPDGERFSGTVLPAKGYIPTVGQQALLRRTENGMFIMQDYPTK